MQTLDPSRIEAYDYDLPRELIAQEPAAQRVDARLMVIDRFSGEISHHLVRDLPDLLLPGDTLVMNDSKVLAARLVGHRTRTGGRWQGLFLRADVGSGVWEVLTKTRGTLVAGETLTIQDREGRDSMLLTVVSRTDDGHLLVTPSLPTNYPHLGGRRFEDDTPPAEWLDAFGRVPIPPYIRDGHMVDADRVSYQTCVAKEPGSVAAPTAGLHFTPELLQQIRSAGVATVQVTLHVGIGTFRPIATESLDDHAMHAEYATVSPEVADEIRRRRERGRTVAVGSTSVRTLESAYDNGSVRAMHGETDLFIRPGYAFNAVDVMMTNFHLPKSSLMVMVAAMAGLELIHQAYAEAIRQEYRFYSYGDAMLIV